MIRILPLLLLLLLPGGGSLAADEKDAIENALAFAKNAEGKIWHGQFEAHWAAEGSHFWYSVATGPHTREWVQVQPEIGSVQRSPSGEGLERGRSETADGRSHASDDATALRFTNRRSEPIALFWIDTEGKAKAYGVVPPGQSHDQPTFVGHLWRITDGQGGVLRELRGGDARETVLEPGDRVAPRPEKRRERQGGNFSPDGQWEVRFERDQVVLHDAATGADAPLTTDGSGAESYRGPARWAPDGKAFVALAVRPAPGRQVTEVQSSPPDQLQPKVHTFEYLKPGDELPKVQPVLFRMADRSVLRIETALFPNNFTPDGALRLEWSPQSDEFRFDYNQRGHQLYRVLAVNAETGRVRTVVEETSKTFIDYTNKTWRQWLPETGELLWMSERDGWCHLWLYDAATGQVKNQVTKGAWVVRQVLRVDAETRTVWFMASGLRPGEDPYHLHLCRAKLDGSGFERLTEGDGNHAVEFSPDRRYFIDRWSRADLPPVAELRRSEDGGLVCVLEMADDGAMLGAGWTLPERFVAKGRDGKTEIYGVMVRPSPFDPARKYPVLEEVYAGPHGAFAPKTFSVLERQHALAQLGFIVVQADGMGTNHRGQAFHDVAWQNLQDAGFPDRIAWIKAAASTRPWMDLARVGIYGGSAGGQNAMRALLDHHDFYRAAFADCGCHDNRMDKIWWNEQWLGWPVGEAYRKASNVEDAAKLEGALMLCVGELDTNVDPSSTMQVVNALEKAGKDFELLIITNSNHGSAESPYGTRRRMEFFRRQLLAP